MIKVCFQYDPRGWNRDLWLYLITGFGVQGYERGRDKDMTGNHFGTIAVDDVSELPEARIVCLTPKAANNVSADVCLYDHVHVESDIYYFGSDRGLIEPEDFLDREVVYVYIPQTSETHQDELWSHQAGAITIYDIHNKDHGNT